MNKAGLLGIAFLAAGSTVLSGCDSAIGANNVPKDAVNVSKDRAVCVETLDDGLKGAKVVDPQKRLIVQFGLGTNIFAPENEGVALYPKGERGAYRFKEDGDFVIGDDECIVHAGGKTIIYAMGS
ncbi:MAG: hypothetical protein PHX61_12660 [Alphaproteobacteria bacterium]|nr:hypothetical protein [Alphaproteobacteria bacterium]